MLAIKDPIATEEYVAFLVPVGNSGSIAVAMVNMERRERRERRGEKIREKRGRKKKVLGGHVYGRWWWRQGSRSGEGGRRKGMKEMKGGWSILGKTFYW